MKFRTALKGLSVSEILHSEDKCTIETLNKIPGFKTLVDKTIVNIMEKYAEIEYSAEGVNVTSKIMPVIHRQLMEACRLLDIKDIPVCSTDWLYGISSFTIGEQRKRMVLYSPVL